MQSQGTRDPQTQGSLEGEGQPPEVGMGGVAMSQSEKEKAALKSPFIINK